MTIVLGFVIAAAVTFFMRGSVSVVGSLLGAERSAALHATVTAITPMVLAAMVASAVFVRHGSVQFPTLAEVTALGTAFTVARRTGNVSLALAVGLPVHAVVTVVTAAGLADSLAF